MKEAKSRPMKVITRMTKVLIFLQKNIDETEDDDEDQHQKWVMPQKGSPSPAPARAVPPATG